MVGAGPRAEVRGRLLGHLDHTPARRARLRRLGSAESYSVLGNAVTSTGATAMSEDLGSATTLAATPAPIVLGQTRIGAAADSAETDMKLAYADAMLRGAPAPIPADLAGASFTPGVYKAQAARGFSAGMLTLDARNDPDAVFIFQIGGALTTEAATQVNLVNGANTNPSSGQGSTIVRHPPAVASPAAPFAGTTFAR